MKKHSIQEWMLTVRPWSFTASALPVTATVLYLWWRGCDVNLLMGLWVVVSIVLFHAAGNVLSDWNDFRKGVDAEDTYGTKTLTSGMFTLDEFKRIGIVLLAVALLNGIALMLCTCWQLLTFGVAALLCVLMYPPMKFNALGDLLIVLAFAFLPALGTGVALCGEIVWSALLVAVPAGLLTDSILHANNTRDIQTDTRAGIHTAAIIMGRTGSMVVYYFELIFSYVWVIACAVAGAFPLWTLLVVVTLPIAYGNIREMSGYKDAATIACLDQNSAKLQLTFLLVLSVSLVLAYFL